MQGRINNERKYKQHSNIDSVRHHARSNGNPGGDNMRYDRNNDRFDLAYDEAVGNFTEEQREHMEREQALINGGRA